jgi:hypothetical protein
VGLTLDFRIDDINWSIDMGIAWRNRLQQHWFLLVAAAIIAGDLSAVAYSGWATHARAMEAALLFDFAVLIPALAAWRSRANPWKAILHALCLASLAVWGLGHVVPAEHQVILGKLAWLRPVVMVFAVLAEIGILLAFYRGVFGSDEDAAALSRKMAADAGLPKWLEKWVAIEVKIWRAVRDSLRRLGGGK